MKIDLGGIAKGYTSQRIAKIYKKDGVKSGVISLGGNVQAIGTKTDGTLSDTLSTTLFVMGKDKAISYWKEHSKEFNMILVDENNKVYISQGIKDHFSSDSDFTVIKK